MRRAAIGAACGVCLALVMSSAAASAQTPGVEMGVKGGLELAEAKIEGEGGSPPLDYRFGGVVGVFFTLPMASWLELQPEALYAMKGARYDVFDVKTTMALDYLEVPVLARVSFGRYYIVGGPSFGVRLRARSLVDFGSTTENIDITDDIERFDLGVAAGGGVEVGRRLVFEGRYTYGLRDVDKDKADKVKITNRAISITAGFRF